MNTYKYITLLTLLTAGAVSLRAAEPVDILETWSGGDTAGWINSSEKVVLSNPGGYLNMKFAKQSTPYLVQDIARTDIEPEILLTNMSFRFMAVDVYPSSLRVCFHSSESGNMWYRCLPEPPTGCWVTCSVAVHASDQWVKGPCSPRQEFLQDLQSVDWVGVYVRRHGDPASQNYRIDDFRVQGYVLPELLLDTDGDGLTDRDELIYDTDPTLPDTDGDGYSDGVEVSAGTNPNDPTDYMVSFIVTKPVCNALVRLGGVFTVGWAGQWPLGAVAIDLWQGTNFVLELVKELPASANNMSWHTSLPMGLRAADNYWISVIDTDNANDYAVSELFSVTRVAVLLQRGDGIGAHCLLGPESEVAARASICGRTPDWALRDIDGARVLAQQGDGGMVALVQLGLDGNPIAWPVSDPVPGWVARSLDGARILAQQGDGGMIGLVQLGLDGNPIAWIPVSDPVPGWIARSLDGNRILMQHAESGMAGVLGLGPDGSLISWAEIIGSIRGWVIRSLDGNSVLLQFGDTGTAGIWELGTNGKPVSWTKICNSIPGWVIRAIDTH